MQPNMNFYYPQQPNYNNGMKIDRIASLEEAKKYPAIQGQTVYLLDANEPYMYIKTFNPQGQSIFTALLLQEVDINKLLEKKKYVSMTDLEQFGSNLENRLLAAIKSTMDSKKEEKPITTNPATIPVANENNNFF